MKFPSLAYIQDGQRIKITVYGKGRKPNKRYYYGYVENPYGSKAWASKGRTRAEAEDKAILWLNDFKRGNVAELSKYQQVSKLKRLS